MLRAHPQTPAILTTHEMAYDGGNGTAVLSGPGQRLWDELVKDSDQIFLTINGHFWPPARTVLRNAAGHDVHVDITNYQDRYYGGSALIRLYHFDLSRNTIDVETFSPWILGQDPDQPRRQRPTGTALGRGPPPRPARARQPVLQRRQAARPRCVPANGRWSAAEPCDVPQRLTIEAFVKLPSDVRTTNHAWMSVLSRMGAGYDAGKTGGDPAEPLATLSLSDGMGLQWAVLIAR